MSKRLDITNQSLDDYIEYKLNEVINANIKKIKSYLDKHTRQNLYTRPELISIIQDRLDEKYKNRIMLSKREPWDYEGRWEYIHIDHEKFDEDKDLHIWDNENWHVKMSDYADYLKGYRKNLSYGQHVKKKIELNTLHAITNLTDFVITRTDDQKFNDRKKEEFQNEILYLVYLMENFNEDQRIILTIDGKMPTIAEIIKKTGVENIKITNAGNLRTCLHFESKDNFYLLLLNDGKIIKRHSKSLESEMHISSKYSDPITVHDYELSKEGFEIIEMMNIGEIETIKIKDYEKERRCITIKQNSFKAFILTTIVFLLALFTQGVSHLSCLTLVFCFIFWCIYAVNDQTIKKNNKKSEKSIEVNLTRRKK